jgi:hypothetical protein
MNKEVNEQACYLELPNGMDAKSRAKYTQEFVRAPASLHPPKRPPKMEHGKAKQAMAITLHC